MRRKNPYLLNILPVVMTVLLFGTTAAAIKFSYAGELLAAVFFNVWLAVILLINLFTKSRKAGWERGDSRKL